MSQNPALAVGPLLDSRSKPSGSRSPIFFIADDDPDIRAELTDFLEAQGRNVEAVADGVLLLDRLAARAGPAVVLLDLGMPHGDICETLSWLSALPTPVVLVLCSGQHQEILENVACLARAKRIAVAGSIVKPIDPVELSRLLDRARDTLMDAAQPVAPEEPPAEISREDLLSALAHNEFRVLMQPLYSLRSNSCRSVEALARWNHPARGVLSPGAFLPAIRQHDLLFDFTATIAGQVFAWSRHYAERGRPIEIGINVPPSLLCDRRLADLLIAEAANYEVEPGDIILELMEDEILPAPEAVLASMIRLRMAGFRLAIDDFGAEFSALNRLMWLPVSIIKIDRSLTTDASPNAPIILEKAIELAHRLNMTVLAEGIEDRRALAKMRALGCDMVQGFAISIPLPPDEVTSWLSRGHAKAAQPSIPAF